MLFSCFAEVLSGPKNQTVAPGAFVHFNCHARGVSVLWFINNRTPYPEESYTANGFMFAYVTLVEPPSQNGEYNYTVTVEARLSNNNTHIVCKAPGQRHGQAGIAQGFLIIAGKYILCLTSLPIMYSERMYFSGLECSCECKVQKR